MNKPKDHHYLPEVYLKSFFSLEEPKVYRYSLQYRKWKKLSPGGLGYEPNLYGFGDDAKNVEEFFGLFETRWPEVYKNILKKNISSEGEFCLACFLYAQCLRIPFSREKLKQKIYDDKRNAFKDDQKVNQIKSDILREAGIDLPIEVLLNIADGISPEDVREAEITRRSLNDFSKNVKRVIDEMEWFFYYSDDQLPFITSDCPCLIGKKDETIGIPLGKNVFFIGHAGERENNFEDVSSGKVEQMNKNIIEVAQKFIVSSRKDFPACEQLSLLKR